MSARHWLLATVLWVALALVAVGCAAPAAPGAPAAEPPSAQEEAAAPAEAAPAQPPAGPTGELRVALSTMPNSIYMPRAAERNAANAASQLYDSLVWVDDEGNLVPALATEWEVSEDGTEYIFRLRQDVTFHNGEPFNADAVVFSWEVGKDPENEYAYIWEMADSVEKIDEYTVRITTPEPNALFLRFMAYNWMMVPPQYFQEVGVEGFEQHPIGTGPFKFVEWKRGDRIVYEANEDYWREGMPKVKTLIFRPIPESSTRVAAARTGEVHIAQRLSAEEAKTLEDATNVRILSYPVDRVYYIAFNNLTTGKGMPTEDVRVRLAMNYAVDRQAIVDALFDGKARLSTGFITPANLGFDESLEPYPYDPDRARELLAEAGYPDGFQIGMACPTGAYTNFEQVCEAVAGYLGDVGIQVDLEFMESGQYWDLEANKELPPLFGDSWSSALGEAYNRLLGALGGWDATYSSWYDEKIAEYLDQIIVTIDDEARAQLYRELQRYMYENPPFIYLYEPWAFEAVNVAVHDYRPRAAEQYFLMYTWIEEQ